MLKLYSNGCAKCKILEAKLIQKDITYEKISDYDEIVSFGILSMPLLKNDGECVMTFMDAIKWVGKQ